ncbi:recombinase family protein [Kitasatospora sp. NPDC049258]|uniref:recombinase family protein n=1 Tax=Kitasatospora sp. NPDC049258 TaxID=3155394 RepID=UPI0034138BAC
MTATAPAEHRLPPAAYLRCYPRDPRGMQAHRAVLRRFAGRLGLPAPVIYLDNGVLSAGTRPGLQNLTTALMEGLHTVLLVPGRWVFSVDDQQAARSSGCSPTRDVGASC